MSSLEDKLETFRILLARLDAQLAEEKALARHDWWRRDYYIEPYLYDAPDDYVSDRFVDVMNNNCTLTEQGQIVPLMSVQFEYFTSRFTHLIEEMNYRPGLLQKTDLKSRYALKPTHPERPAGFTILGARSMPSPPFLVKLGKAEHLRDMFSHGRMRLSPASLYSDPSLNAAIQDDELRQRAWVKFGGLTLNVLSRDSSNKETVLRGFQSNVGLTVNTPSDFYVCCFAATYDYRLVDDFEADAMIVIKDRPRFLRRLQRKAVSALPNWRFQARDVDYFDPFFVNPTKLGTGFAKHFRYSYQNEFRAVWTPQGLDKPSSLQVKNISIGPMRDIAEFFTMPKRR